MAGRVGDGHVATGRWRGDLRANPTTAQAVPPPRKEEPLASAPAAAGALGALEPQLLSVLMDHLPDNIFFKDPDGRYLRVNRAMARFLGLREPHEAEGRTDADFFAAQHAELSQRDEREVMRTGLPLVGKDERQILPDGSVRWVTTTKLPLRDESNAVVGTFGISRDITARKQMEDQLYEQAFYDPLTRLPNRALFLDRLNHVLRRARRRGDYQYSVLFLDIDRFKGVNDSLGHLAGDQLLVGIARRLERCVRPGDTVARLGGDEFTILLDGISADADALRVADRVHREMAAPFPVSDHDIFCTASIGIALGASHYNQADEVLRDADTAMYHAKNAGRARHVLFREGMHESVKSTLRMETDLRRALERHEFRLFYQPIVRVGSREDSGRILGFEALLRWEHPQRGLVAPDAFIGLAEETGLICPIGLWAVEEACAELRRMTERHPRIGQGLQMNVNISPRQFNEPSLQGELRRALTSTGIDPRRINMEITESALMHNVSAAAAMMAEVRALGVKICIDDFGMGYSSLAQLERFTVDGLKIDRAFTFKLGATTSKATEIVRSIVSLARNLALDVTAEGVETEAQLDAVTRLGCDRVQGFYYARPVSARDAHVLLEREHLTPPAAAVTPPP